MSDVTVVLVHGAFAESASWNGVIQRLSDDSVAAVAVANPLRGVATDADYVRDVVGSLNTPVILVGHSHGGQVITQAAADIPPSAPWSTWLRRSGGRRDRAGPVEPLYGQHTRRGCSRPPADQWRQ